MKVLFVIPSLDPSSGGPTRSAKGLCRALDAAGVELTLLVLSGSHPFENSGNIQVVRGLNGLSEIENFDLVHLSSLWNPQLHQIVKMCQRSCKPYVISPRGMLDPWALGVKRWKKRLALFLYQRRDLNGAAAIHVTAQAEADHVMSLGIRRPMLIIPNGVELPERLPVRCPKGCDQNHTAIFLSRLHPGKGLLMLAEAWAKVRPVGWKMKVVGPDTYGHKKDVLARVSELAILGDWEFVDEMDDERKWAAYRSADLLIHPSVSENFGITIAEGLAAGLPVIATKGAPWKDLQGFHCGWWIDCNVDSLARALAEATSASEEVRYEMGMNGQKLIEDKYRWPAIGRKMQESYQLVSV